MRLEKQHHWNFFYRKIIRSIIPKYEPHRILLMNLMLLLRFSFMAHRIMESVMILIMSVYEQWRENTISLNKIKCLYAMCMENGFYQGFFVFNMAYLCLALFEFVMPFALHLSLCQSIFICPTFSIGLISKWGKKQWSLCLFFLYAFLSFTLFK